MALLGQGFSSLPEFSARGSQFIQDPSDPLPPWPVKHKGQLHATWEPDTTWALPSPTQLQTRHFLLVQRPCYELILQMKSLKLGDDS